MSAAMDRALMALSLEEEDVPFTMPYLPGFSSAEENVLSLMGHTLNPECQKLPGLILTMPRKWQKEGRVRGVALTQERFQFIFNNEHDLLDVLEKGVQTYNEWPIVLERWVENPPEDYLQYIPLWVQIRKIPVDYYTTAALTALGDLIGKTKVVAFDPTKPITQDFIRVQVIFNVAHPLRMSKVINIRGGKTATIHFNYEKIQKRCFTCQRLNHEKSCCPLNVKIRQDEAMERRNRVLAEKAKAAYAIVQGDPLFGVLEESQVGLSSATGRPKIAKEVLKEMRRYLTAETGEDLAIKVDKVKKSVREAEMDPVTQRTVLHLEPMPMVTHQLNKGKGLVFDYGNKVHDDNFIDLNVNPNKLMSSAIVAAKKLHVQSDPTVGDSATFESSDGSFSGPFSDCPTVFLSGFSEPSHSGSIRKRPAPRRRPPKSQRKPRKGVLKMENMNIIEARREGKQEVGSKKRKCGDVRVENVLPSKAQCLKVVPNEGSPSSQ